jgi:hypothetical protein
MAHQTAELMSAGQLLVGMASQVLLHFCLMVEFHGHLVTVTDQSVSGVLEHWTSMIFAELGTVEHFETKLKRKSTLLGQTERETN